MSVRPPFAEVAAREARAAIDGTWSERGILEVLVAALRDHPAPGPARDAALAFEANVRVSPILAGHALAEFVEDGLPGGARA